MGVEFQEDNNGARRDLYGKPTPKLAAWLMAKGLARDEAGANKLQVIAAIVFLILAIFFFLR